MKLALFFLSILVVISHGQFHLPWEGNNWRTPYFRPQHVVRNYHPVYYDYLHERVPPLHQFSPINRVAHMNPELVPSFMDAGFQNVFSENEFPNDQPRFKGFNRYRPSSVAYEQEPRFFFKNVASAYSNVFDKTATFTLTSSVTLTTVETCIAAINILDAPKTTYCRRKRDFLGDLADDFQFDIVPSRSEQVMTTKFPSPDLMLDGYTIDGNAISLDSIPQVDPDGETSFQDVTTSFKDPNQVSTSVEVPAFLSWWNNLRGKMLFSHSLASTTVTSFSFTSTTVTKTVAIADEAQIKCLPLGWVVCY
ncbi:uncharacterized protein LOC124336283 isoform X2 [Daphnia pulicaria]|uniref:uncharacterized protein LOC124336283 isoform X2 n=1 Tax=Daphnia pulicaria TaxID=35523 RepID=UPI001EEBF98B|nr:uncharacterized protein LOC124336283 isoform X2 [Daphnia pulicaria]